MCFTFLSAIITLLNEFLCIIPCATGIVQHTGNRKACCHSSGQKSDEAPPPRAAAPETPPDRVCELKTRPEAALIYRLSGDYNPVHADPDVARAAGFERPILHGLCSFGVSGHALLKTLCGWNPARLKEIGCRFSSPVYPGETLRVEMWQRGEAVQFRTWAVQRKVVVLSHGSARITP